MRLRVEAVNPTGMVLLITITASGLTDRTWSMTCSTAEVSKKLRTLS